MVSREKRLQQWEVATVRRRLAELADAAIAEHSMRYFKCGPGQYGEGDRFLGIRVPVLRSLVRHCRELDLDAVDRLLHSAWHEERLLALLILVDRYSRAAAAEQREIFDFYLGRTERINNWDLVDLSCPRIVGEHLLERDRQPLYRLAGSAMLWERRVGVVSTFAFIRRCQHRDTLNICEMLLDDDQDLIHKAAGWMLREVGKRDHASLCRFLDRFCRRMPRVMLRYAIEKLEPELRREYLREKSTKGPSGPLVGEGVNGEGTWPGDAHGEK